MKNAVGCLGLRGRDNKLSTFGFELLIDLRQIVNPKGKMMYTDLVELVEE